MAEEKRTPQEFMTSGSAAHELRRSIPTVKAYEAKGILRAIRTDTGMRLYDAAEVRALAVTLRERGPKGAK